MRKLKTADLFAFCRVMKAVGVKEAVQSIAKDANSTADIWDKGFDLIWTIFDAATEKGSEKAIYRFLAGPFEMTEEAVEALDLADFLQMVKKLAQENDLVAFFKSAARAMK